MATAKKSIPFVLIALACVPVWAQAGKNATQGTPQVFDASRAAAPAADALPLTVNPQTYIIGPEDILKIEVYRDPELSRMVNVRPDGKITLLLIGDVQAEGLTPERLSVQVKEGYSTLINNPEVLVTVMQVNSKFYTVSGKVNRPQRFPLVTPIRIFDALGLTGGFQDFANQSNIQIIHANGKPSYFDYKGFLKQKKKAMDQNILLQNGDTVVVK